MVTLGRGRLDFKSGEGILFGLGFRSGLVWAEEGGSNMDKRADVSVCFWGEGG